MRRLVFALVPALVAWGCSGSAGSAGPAGPAGARGPAGADAPAVSVEALVAGHPTCAGGGARIASGLSEAFACNGAEGPRGLLGPQGDPGPPGVADPAQVVLVGTLAQAGDFHLTGSGTLGGALTASSIVLGAGPPHVLDAAKVAALTGGGSADALHSHAAPTAATIGALVQLVDGAGSGIDADTVDGMHAAGGTDDATDLRALISKVACEARAGRWTTGAGCTEYLVLASGFHSFADAKTACPAGRHACTITDLLFAGFRSLDAQGLRTRSEYIWIRGYAAAENQLFYPWGNGEMQCAAGSAPMLNLDASVAGLNGVIGCYRTLGFAARAPCCLD